ncbi:MAG TPA: redoxin domain-containing protein [Fimbriimonas sp.]
MKATTIALSAGFGVAVTGALTLFLASRATPHSIQRSIYYDSGPKHPVTDEMTRKLQEMSRREAPHFELRDVDGRPVVLGRTRSDRPQFLYFVMDGCPCSEDVEPLLQKLYHHFGERVDFVAVTDAKPEQAAKWSRQMLMPYPLVSDPKLEVVKAYQAVNSVYSALVNRDGQVVKMWPGYSQGILKEMNDAMAEILGEKPRAFDASYAPVEKTSGCSFAVR